MMNELVADVTDEKIVDLMLWHTRHHVEKVQPPRALQPASARGTKAVESRTIPVPFFVATDVIGRHRVSRY